MDKLQTLDVCCNAPNDLTQILLVCANIEELTINTDTSIVIGPILVASDLYR